MKKIALLALTIVALTACQAEQDSKPTPENSAKADTQKTYVDHGMPSSVGPSTPPEEMKGPTTPPPSEDTAKVITTDEKIRLTLPIKTE